MIGVLIPTQHKRDFFLYKSLDMLKRQTLQPDEVLVMDWAHVAKIDIDLNWRYINGLIYLFNIGCDCIALWEEDDYYSDDYLKNVITLYQQSGKPNLFGIRNTIYYHLGLKRFALLRHPGHASAMGMVLGRGIFNECVPNEWDLDFDYFLTRRVKNAVYVGLNDFTKDEPVISIGIKGFPTSDTMGHKKESQIYHSNAKNSLYLSSVFDDSNLEFLKKHTGVFFEFYLSLINSFNEAGSKL